MYGGVTVSLSAPVPCMVRGHEPNAWGLGLVVSAGHKTHANLERQGAGDHMLYLTKKGVRARVSMPRPDQFFAQMSPPPGDLPCLKVTPSALYPPSILIYLPITEHCLTSCHIAIGVLACYVSSRQHVCSVRPGTCSVCSGAVPLMPSTGPDT